MAIDCKKKLWLKLKSEGLLNIKLLKEYGDITNQSFLSAMKELESIGYKQDIKKIRQQSLTFLNNTALGY